MRSGRLPGKFREASFDFDADSNIGFDIDQPLLNHSTATMVSSLVPPKVSSYHTVRQYVLADNMGTGCLPKRKSAQPNTSYAAV